MRKKLLLYITTSLLTISVLTACGSKEEETKKEKTTKVAEIESTIKKETNNKIEKDTTKKTEIDTETSKIAEKDTTENQTTSNNTVTQQTTNQQTQGVVNNQTTTPVQTQQQTTSKKQETTTTKKKEQSTTSKKEETTKKKPVIEDDETFEEPVFPVSNENVDEFTGKVEKTVFGIEFREFVTYNVTTYSDGSTEKVEVTRGTKEVGTYKIPTDKELYNYAKGVVDKNWSLYEEALVDLNSYRKAFNNGLASGKNPNPKFLTDFDWEMRMKYQTEPLKMYTLDKELCIYATMRAIESYLSGIADHTRPDGGYYNDNDLGIIVNDGMLQEGGSVTNHHIYTLDGHYNTITSENLTKVGFGVYYNISVVSCQ